MEAAGASGAGAARGPGPPADAPLAAPQRRLAAALAGVSAATALALFLSQGQPVLTLFPLLAATGVLVLALVPLRVIGAALLFLVVLVDAPGERPHFMIWTNPLLPVGDLLYENLHKHLGVSALRFSLLDALVVAALVVSAVRAAAAARRGEAPARDGGVAACITFSLLAFVAAVFAFEVWGLARGGDLRNSLWQVRPLLLLALAAFVFAASLRFPRDLPLVATILLGTAAVKAVVAAYVHFVVARRLGIVPQYVATHSDSVLFVCAALLTFTLWYERRTRGTWLLLLGLTPLLALAIVVNNRRLAYVELALALSTWWLMVPRSRLKVSLARLGMLLAPIGLLYLAAGWNSGSSLFKGARIVRSIVDSDSDRSTGERDVENYNLAVNLKMSPLLGSGFGHEYRQFTYGDDISGIFPQWRYIPHNSILGLWAFTGLAGYTFFWLPLVVTAWLAARAHACSRRAVERAAAMTVMTCVICFAVQAYGDMGLNSARCMFLAGLAAAVAGRLAVAVGAWPGADRAAGA